MSSSAMQVAILVAFLAASGCSGTTTEADRFLEALLDASRNARTQATYAPSTPDAHTVVLIVGPQVDSLLLQGAGLPPARIESIIQAAPTDFKAAVATVVGDSVTVGWFLGNYFSVLKSAVITKSGGEAVTIELKYGGPLPEISMIR